MRSVIAILNARRSFFTSFGDPIRSCGGENPHGVLQPRRGDLEHRRDVILDRRTDFGKLLVDRHVRLDYTGQVRNRARNLVLHGFERCLQVRGKSSCRSLQIAYK